MGIIAGFEESGSGSDAFGTLVVKWSFPNYIGLTNVRKDIYAVKRSSGPADNPVGEEGKATC